MNKLCWLIVVFFTYGVCKGQNLVPNYSFEILDSCPTDHNQLFLASPWQMPDSTTYASSDLFNTCNTLFWGVPSNVIGYQSAHTGVGYAGVFTYGVNLREYLQVQLSSPLLAGNIYQVEMYVSPAELAGLAIDAIGIYISIGPVSGTGNCLPLPFIPQISNPVNNIIDDTLGWTLVSGFYTASGGEDYLTIGNFLDDNNTDTLRIHPGGWRGYYYVDDVSVHEGSSVGINEHIEDGFALYPNPVKNKISIKTKNKGVMEFILNDISSRLILQHKFTNSTSINTEQLAKGIYLYEVRNKNGMIKKGKLAKE